MNKKSKFEDWQLDDAARLKKLVNAHLEKEGITQEEFTSKCGWSQSMIYQHTKPLRPLGLENIAVFAQGLGVSIDRISPRLAQKIRDLSGLVEPARTKKYGTK